MTSSDNKSANLAAIPEDQAALTARAVTASVVVATAHGLRVDDPHMLADGCAVRVYLRPASVVARVSTLIALLRTPIEAWLAREVAVADFLAARGAPVVAPSDILPPGPHHRDGLVMTFWRYAQPVSDAVPDPAVTGRMLAELREYPATCHCWRRRCTIFRTAWRVLSAPAIRSPQVTSHGYETCMTGSYPSCASQPARCSRCTATHTPPT